MVEQLGESVNVHEYAYNYELEHIMPQAFKTHWGVPAKDIDGNDFVAPTTPEEYRKKYVYQIGNMTIITPKANKSIKNYDIKTINGYSGQTPPDWHLDVLAEDYEERVADWLNMNNIDTSHLYVYRLQENCWEKYGE